MPDKYTALWLSYSSISDFLQCPRAYYLKNVYKDPKTGHKISLMNPPLALGQSVHNVLESLSVLPKEARFSKSLITKFDEEWKKVSGKKGGFLDPESEYRYKRRGEEMLKRVYNNPGPIERLSVKINKDLPHFWLSEKEEILLCGKIDWMEYLPETNSVHIIDFKTGKRKEDDDSLQLPIYNLLARNCQSRNVAKASYWYLETDNRCTEVKLPDVDESLNKILEIARRVKLARQLNKMTCPNGGCFACRPMEKIINGEAELIGQDDFRRDVYILKEEATGGDDSVIL